MNKPAWKCPRLIEFTSSFSVKFTATVLLIISFLQAFFVFNKMQEQSFIYLAYLLIFLTIVFLFIAFQKLSTTKNLIVSLVIISLILKIYYVIKMDTKPVSDFLLLYDYAKQIAEGDLYCLNEKLYFRTWCYQTGYVLYLASVIKIFGDNLLILKILNCIFATAGSVTIYYICRCYATQRSSFFVFVLSLFTPSSVLLLPVITNQHLANMLCLISVFFLLSGLNSTVSKLLISKNILLSALFAALAHIIRPIGTILLGSFICFCVIYILWQLCISNINKTKIFSINAILFVFVYILTTSFASYAIKLSGINQGGLSNNFPEWKFVTGLNMETNGRYSTNDSKYLFTYEGDDRKSRADKLIEDRMPSSYEEFIDLASSKIHFMWATPDDTLWAFKHLQKDGNINPTEEKLQAFSVSYNALIYILLAASAIILLVKKNLFPNYIAIILAAYFIAHIFIEIQARYRDFYIIVSLPLIAVAVDKFILVNHKLKNSKS